LSSPIAILKVSTVAKTQWRIEMTMELTFYPGAAICRSPGRTKPKPRQSDASRSPARPAEDAPGFGQDLGPGQTWRAGDRRLQRIEDAFAAMVFVGLLALGTLTFGYAFDGLTAAHAASAPAVAVNR